LSGGRLYYPVTNIIMRIQQSGDAPGGHSTVTDLARLRGNPRFAALLAKASDDPHKSPTAKAVVSQP
jgi:hypothetical protein